MDWWLILKLTGAAYGGLALLAFLMFTIMAFYYRRKRWAESDDRNQPLYRSLFSLLLFFLQMVFLSLIWPLVLILNFRDLVRDGLARRRFEKMFRSDRSPF